MNQKYSDIYIVFFIKMMDSTERETCEKLLVRCLIHIYYEYIYELIKKDNPKVNADIYRKYIKEAKSNEYAMFISKVSHNLI